MNYIFQSSVIAVAMITNALTLADDSPPTTPQLSFTIYSGSDAELFWSRSIDDSVNLTYQLDRNGESVFTGDGLSFYDNNLSPGEEYNYTLTVVGEDGLISQSVGVGFDTNDRFLIGQQSLLPPTGLRVDVYSSSALELFWDRVHNEALEYEITQDGFAIGITNGTSFFIDSGIEANASHTFEVTAIRQDNPGITNSEPAFIRVNIADGSSSTELPLSPPQNVSLIQYSNTAAELFWDRPSPLEGVVATNIYRNGDLIGSTPGISFFDNTRTDNTSYAYELIAINNIANQSEPAILIDGNDAQPPETLFTLDENNLDNFLENIARIVTGNVYNDLVVKAISLGQLNAEGLSIVSVSDARPPAVETIIYSCEGGGQMSSDRPTSAGGLFLTNTLDNCILEGEVFNGSVLFESSAFGQILTMNGLQRTYVDGNTSTISGTYIEPEDNIGEIRSLSVSEYTEVNADGTRRPVNDYRTTAIDTTDESRPGIASALFSDWTASGPFSNDLSITATTLVEFDREDSITDFTRGTLLMEIEDVITVTLEADSGDPDTFQVFVEENGTTVGYARSWNNENRLRLLTEFP